MQSRYNLIVQEHGEAIDSGRFSRADRHQATFPTDQYLKYSIETDPNHDSKGMKAAKKSWAKYKTENDLSDEKIKEDLVNNIDHLARCFQRQCPPTKRAKQRKWELANLENPISRHQIADGDIQFAMYQFINENYPTSEEESTLNSSDSSNNVSYEDEDKV